jgi:hypothetical protein
MEHGKDAAKRNVDALKAKHRLETGGLRSIQASDCEVDTHRCAVQIIFEQYPKEEAA